MKISIKTYVVLAVVFLASFGLAYLLPTTEIFKNLATTPAILALVAAVYQILKDQAAFERQSYLQRQQQIFSLGTASHMAKVAFDKHAEFCEKYMSEVHETGGDLFRLGPRSSKVGEHLNKLISLKKEYAAWVAKDVAKRLEPFENKLGEMSAQAGLVEDYKDQPSQERANAVKAMHAVYRSILGIGETDTTRNDQEITTEDIKERIRSILGINELTKMRTLLVSGAIRFLEEA